MTTIERLAGDGDAVILSARPTAMRATVGLDQADHVHRMLQIPVIRLADPDANCRNRHPTESLVSDASSDPRLRCQLSEYRVSAIR